MNQDTFAYLTSTGQSISLRELSQEVATLLDSQGTGMDLHAVQGILRAARRATEATAQGEIPAERGDYIHHVNQSLRQSRYILANKDIEACLKAMVVMLSRLDISRVIYLD